MSERLVQEQDILGSASNSSGWEEVGIPTSLEDFDRMHATLRMPKQLKAGPLLTSLVDTTSPTSGAELDVLGEVGSHCSAGSLQPKKDAFTRVTFEIIIADWNRLQSNVDLLNRIMKPRAILKLDLGMYWRLLLAHCSRSRTILIQKSNF
jgi:hypothetical protein